MGKQTMANVDDFFDYECDIYVALTNMEGLIRSPEMRDRLRGGATNNT